MKPFIIALLLMGSCVLAQTTRHGYFGRLYETTPTTQPESHETRPVNTTPSANTVDAVIEKAIQKLKNEDASALNDLMEAFSHYPRSTKCLDANHAMLCHLIAYCHMKADNWEKARPFADMLLDSKLKMNRSLILNLATLDVVQRAEVMRAIFILDKYLAANPKDEPTVNLMGYAITVALKGNITNARLAPFMSNMERYNTELEQTKKEKLHHWGSKWLDKDQWSELQERRKTAQNNIDEANRNLQRAMENYNRAMTELRSIPNDTRSKSTYDNNDSSRLATAQAEVARCQRTVTRCQSRLDKAESKMPHPVWENACEPVLPEK